MISLATALRDLRGRHLLRAVDTDALERLEIRTIADLVRHLPMRYERIEALTPIALLAEGTIVSAEGEITATKMSGGGGRFGRGKSRFQAVLVDDTGRLDLVWFNQAWMQKKVMPGMRVRVQGLVKRYGVGMQMSNPRLTRADEDVPTEASSDTVATSDDRHAPTRAIAEAGSPAEEGEHAAGTDGSPSAEGSAAVAAAEYRPVYPASESISSEQIRRVMDRVLPDALPLIEDHLSAEFRRAHEILELREAYRLVHKPGDEQQAGEARRRLAYDELLQLQLAVFMRRAQVRTRTVAPVLAWSAAIDGHIRSRVPFTLTPAQDQVIADIVRDVGKSEPANRLIQGDVGSGKTVVAVYAMLLAVASKRQAAMMAPTELLAEQHWGSIAGMLKGSKLRVVLLTGSMSAGDRRDALGAIARGDVDIIVGTHALLSESVEFHDLGLVVIDEQHRFGVHQRAQLRQKGRTDAATGKPVSPHVLVMTATPIPRTLALTLFGDLDVSTIRFMPPGRTPVATRVVGPERSHEVYAWLRTKIDAGDQAYVVVPAIDTGASSQPGASSQAGASAAEFDAKLPAVEDEDDEAARSTRDVGLNDLRTVLARLESGELAGRKLAALHGRLKPRTRDQIMSRFRAGLIDCLVATTVIEVGVDVANATVMVIEHAEQFGLAQLHQLRGRVGRGSKKSVCVLIGEAKTPDAEARLAVMAQTSDGFVLAEKDLEIRGPGEVFGMRQAGAPPLKVADLMLDRELLAMARRDAAGWIERSPELRGAGEELLRKRVLKQHGQWLGLGDVG